MFLVCFYSGWLLPGEQTPPKSMQKCICIFMQLGENYTSDEREDWPAEFGLLMIFVVSPW